MIVYDGDVEEVGWIVLGNQAFNTSPDVCGLVPCWNDDGDVIPGPQLIHEEAHRRLDEGQLVLIHHGPGDVEQEHEVRRRQVLEVDAPRLQADPHQAMLRFPGRGSNLGVDCQRRDGFLSCTASDAAVVTITVTATTP